VALHGGVPAGRDHGGARGRAGELQRAKASAVLAKEKGEGKVAWLATHAAAHSPEAGTKRRNMPHYLDADSCQREHGEEEVGAALRARRIGMGSLDGGEQRRRWCGGARWQRWRCALEMARGRESRARRGLKARLGRGGGREPVQVRRLRLAVRRRPPRPVDELHAASAVERGVLWLASGRVRRGHVGRT
jgi:hypothetical protein